VVKRHGCVVTGVHRIPVCERRGSGVVKKYPENRWPPGRYQRSLHQDIPENKKNSRSGSASPSLTGASDSSVGWRPRLVGRGQHVPDPPCPPGLRTVLVMQFFQSLTVLLVQGINDTVRDVPGVTLPVLFQQQVARAPDATGVVFGDGRVSYAGPDARANQLAWVAAWSGVGPGVFVVLAVPLGGREDRPGLRRLVACVVAAVGREVVPGVGGSSWRSSCRIIWCRRWWWCSTVCR
jgi:hypothetical protein